MEDAARVIRIVDACLRQVAYDPKTGNFDIDKIASSTTKAGRTLRRDLKKTISELSDGEAGGYAKVDAVIQTLVPTYSKEEVEKVLESMRSQGELIMPKNGVVKLI